jgi:acetylornithine/N-succinyldiaminopimelate aminotransferase
MPEGFRPVAWGDREAMTAAVDASVAAVLIEPIQGEGGVQPAPAGYLEGIRALCDATGALMIVDEVQTGFARTGRWFGFEHAGVSPDVVTMAKGMGNGMPVGACWAPTSIARSFSPGDHGSTFSGTALATSAVLAVIEEMTRLDAPALAVSGGERIRQALADRPGIDGVRGSGLLLGVELASGVAAAEVAAGCLESGLIVNAVNASTIRLAPPLTVSAAEIDEAAEILSGVVSRLVSEGAADE